MCGNWKSVREIIAVSNCVGDQIVNPDAHKKVRVLYNPVDVEKYANGDSSKIINELESWGRGGTDTRPYRSNHKE